VPNWPYWQLTIHTYNAINIHTYSETQCRLTSVVRIFHEFIK